MDSARFVSGVGSGTAGVEPTIAPPVERPRAVAPPAKRDFSANPVPLAIAIALFMEFIDPTALAHMVGSAPRDRFVGRVLVQHAGAVGTNGPDIGGRTPAH